MPVACHDTITEVLFFFHAEIVTSMGHILIVLNEGSLIKEQFDPLSGSQLVLSMLFVNSLLTTSK
jgi:hypothetical protein